MTGLVTDIGLKAVVDSWIADNSIKYIGWGGGSGQGLTDTDLASPFAESRTAGTLTAITTTTTDDTVRVTGSITATAPRSVTEVGVFSAAAGAEMAIYSDFAAIDLLLNDALAFTIDVVIDQA